MNRRAARAWPCGLVWLVCAVVLAGCAADPRPKIAPTLRRPLAAGASSPGVDVQLGRLVSEGGDRYPQTQAVATLPLARLDDPPGPTPYVPATRLTLAGAGPPDRDDTRRDGAAPRSLLPEGEPRELPLPPALP